MQADNMILQKVATYLKSRGKTAYRLAADGKTPCFTFCGPFRFKRNDTENWIDGAMNRKMR